MSAGTHSFRMRALGPYSLTAAARFTEAFPAGQGGGHARLDLAFPADVAWTSVGVRITEDRTNLLAEIVTNSGALPLAQVRSQVERILSLDVDGTDFRPLPSATRSYATFKHATRACVPYSSTARTRPPPGRSSDSASG